MDRAQRGVCSSSQTSDAEGHQTSGERETRLAGKKRRTAIRETKRERERKVHTRRKASRRAEGVVQVSSSHGGGDDGRRRGGGRRGEFQDSRDALQRDMSLRPLRISSWGNRRRRRGWDRSITTAKGGRVGVRDGGRVVRMRGTRGGGGEEERATPTRVQSLELDRVQRARPRVSETRRWAVQHAARVRRS